MVDVLTLKNTLITDHIKRPALDKAFENVRKIMIAEVMNIDAQVTDLELQRKMS
jgi:flavin-binding protein dodecin